MKHVFTLLLLMFSMAVVFLLKFMSEYMSEIDVIYSGIGIISALILMLMFQIDDIKNKN